MRLKPVAKQLARTHGRGMTQQRLIFGRGGGRLSGEFLGAPRAVLRVIALQSSVVDEQRTAVLAPGAQVCAAACGIQNASSSEMTTCPATRIGKMMPSLM